MYGMEIKVVRNSISREELSQMAKAGFGDFVKAVVDVGQGIMAVGGELHADEETLLMEKEGSKREHAWGVNLRTDKTGKDFIEFDSMINIKPAFGNRSREVEDESVRERIIHVVEKLIQE